MNRIKVDFSVFNSFLMGDERAFSLIFYHYSEDILKRIQYNNQYAHK